MVKIIGRVSRDDFDDVSPFVSLAFETAQGKKPGQVEVILRGRDVEVIEGERLIKHESINEVRMRKSHFLILICLSACGLAFTEAQAQPRIFYYHRSAIEACPEEEKKRSVLQLLDESRALADRGVRLLTEGRVKELYALMSTSFKKEYTEARFQDYLATSKQGEGKELHYEYRDQLVRDSTGGIREIDRGDFLVVWYAFTGGTDIVLQVYTRREGVNPVIEKIDTSHVIQDTSAERRDPQAPKRHVCLNIGDSLK